MVRCGFQELLINSLSEYIYTDMIDHQYVGDVQAPLLRVAQLPVHFNVRGYDHIIEIQKPHYVNVLKHRLTRICMYIRTVEGDLMPFQAGNLTLKVHFRKLH